MRKVYIYIIVVIAILVIGFILGNKFIELIAGFMALLGFGNLTRKRAKEIEKKAGEEEKVSAEVKERMKKRREKEKKLAERFKQFFNIFLIVFISISMLGVPVLAEDGEPPPAIEDLKIADNYDELVEDYKEMALIALQYQRLYREAEKDNEILLQSNERLQKLLDAYKEIVDRALKNDISLSAGVNFVPLHPDYSGVTLEIGYTF